MRASASLACLALGLLVVAAIPQSVQARPLAAAPEAALLTSVSPAAAAPVSADAALGPITLSRATAAQTPPELPPAPSGGERGWPVVVREVVATPVFADLDGDGTCEIVVATDWNAAVYSSAGVLWPGWPAYTGGSQQHAAVADIDGDEVPEILLGCTYPSAMIRVFTPQGLSKPGWPVSMPTPNFTNTTCPVVVDLDGDDDLEVGAAVETGVYFFHADGTPLAGWPYLWPVPVNNTQWSAPAVGDLDGDGALEVVVANACYPNWGVHVMRADGTVMPGWPKVIRPVFSSPALADLDDDGDLEIIVQEGDPGSQGSRLWVWHHTGTVFPGWPYTIAVEGHSSRCNPAVADVDGDGDLEIVTATSDGKLHVVQTNGTEYPGFPLPTGAPDYSIISSPSVIDMDQNGEQEIFQTYWLANHQYLSAWHLNGSILTGFPKEIHPSSDLNAHASTHLLDMEGDGDLDVVTAGASMSGGLLWVFEVDGSSFDPATSVADWPKIRRDMVNTGCYPSVDPAAVEAPSGVQLPRLVLSSWPNPFAARTDIHYTLPTASHTRLVVFDAQGRCVATLVDGPRAAGSHVVAWDAQPAQAGVYLYRLEAGSASASRKVVVRR